MGLLACFPCWRGQGSIQPESAQQIGKGSSCTTETDSMPSLRETDANPGAQPALSTCRTSSSDAASPPATRQPSANFDSSRHATARAQLYRRLHTIGSGASGTVSLAVDRQTNERVAIKMVPRNLGCQAQLCIRELVNHQKLGGHPHIIAMREVFLTSNHLALVMEYADGGDMSDMVDRHLSAQGCPLPEARVRALFQQLITAVDYSHRLGVVSRDIKLDNILLSGWKQADRSGYSRPAAASATAAATAGLAGGNSGGGGSAAADETAKWHRVQQLKLADFGLSKALEMSSREAVGTVCGTPEYMAPEILRGLKYSGRKVDIWSCGVVLYTMATGNYPFLARSEEHMKRQDRMARMFPRILSGIIQPLPPGVSPEVMHLVRRMLDPNAATRMTMTELLENPWYRVGLPAELATLNDRLLVQRAVSPPKPVMALGVAVALDAALAAKSFLARISARRSSSGASSVTQLSAGASSSGASSDSLLQGGEAPPRASLEAAPATAAAAAVAAARFGPPPPPPPPPPHQQQWQQDDIQNVQPQQPQKPGRATAAELLSSHQLDSSSPGAGKPLPPSAARASAAAEAAMLAALGMEDLIIMC